MVTIQILFLLAFCLFLVAAFIPAFKTKQVDLEALGYAVLTLAVARAFGAL